MVIISGAGTSRVDDAVPTLHEAANAMKSGSVQSNANIPKRLADSNPDAQKAVSCVGQLASTWLLGGTMMINGSVPLDGFIRLAPPTLAFGFGFVATRRGPHRLAKA